MKKPWNDELTIEDNLRQRLPKLAAKYLASGSKALERQRKWEDVHQFRLATKRFRYRLELFVPFYGPGMNVRLENLKTIQKLLGDANDLVITSGLIKSIADSEELRTQLLAKADAKVKRLRRFWRSTFEVPGAKDRWVHYFSRFPSRRAAAPIASPAQSSAVGQN